MTGATRRRIHRESVPAITARVAALDWQHIAADLDTHGCAVAAAVLSPEECVALVQTYAANERFRSRIVMTRHGFGGGEYKYFAHPLPKVVAGLRSALYPQLFGIANRWNQAMDIDVRSRTIIRSFSIVAIKPARPGRRRCSCNTVRATTTASIKICMGSTSSRCRSPSCSRSRDKPSRAANSY